MSTTTYSLTQVVAPQLVNQFATGNQNSPTLTASADGSHYLNGWVDPLSSDAVLGRIGGQNGQPSGDEFVVNSTQTGNQNDVSLAALQNGGYVAAFTDYSGATPDIRIRLLDASGHAASPDFLADNDPNHQSWVDSQSDVAVLTNGKIVVTNTTTWDPSDSDIHYTMYDQNGVQLQPVYAVNDLPNDSASNSSVAALTGGGFVVTYQVNTGGNNRVEFNIFDGNGNMVKGTDLAGIDIDHIGNNTDIQVIGLADGGFVVAYTDTGWNISGSEITARIYNADGTARTSYIFVNQDGITNGNQDHASIAALSNGDFAISWKSGADEYIRAFDSTGKALTGSTLLAHNVVDGEIAALSGGLIANTYQSTDPDAGGDNAIRSNVFELTRTITATSVGEDLVGDSLSDTLIAGNVGGGHTLEGKGGADHFIGGPGEDLAAYWNATSGVTASLLNPAINTGEAAGDTYVSIEDLYGSTFDDTLQGDNGDNVIYSNGGNDTVYGEGGNDTFWLSDSSGHFFGGDGNDMFWGGYHKDPVTFEGGKGDDTFWISNAADIVIEKQDEGHDVVHDMVVSYTLPDNVEDLWLEPTSSAKYGTANDLDNKIYTNGNDVVKALGGNDTIYTYANNNTIDGGDGVDTVVFAGQRSFYQIAHFADGVHVTGKYGTDVLSNVEFLQFDDKTIPANAVPQWMASNDVGSHPGGYTPAVTGDFNHDGTSDVLWFKSATGDADLWKMSNGQWGGSADIGSHPAGYTPAASGDFNGDGTSDVLWYNPSSGDVDIWSIANGQWAGSVSVGPHPAGWQVAGSGDFNHDGTSDVLWFNPSNGDAEVWKISNGQWAGSVDLGAHPAGYTPVATGDFTGDGTSDVLWYNPTTHDVDLWKISNGQWAGSSDIGTHPAGYAPVGTGDFNQDGTSDVVWFNAATGDTEVWLMDNGHWLASADLGAHPAGWAPAGVGDFDHNGTADILWQQAGTTHLETWMLASG